MKRFFTFLVLALFSVTTSISQVTLADWALTANGTAGTVATNVTAGTFSAGSGVGSFTFASQGAHGNGWSTGALNTTEYFTTAISPDAGFELNITRLNFGERRSSTGIRDYQVQWSKSLTFTSPTTIATVNVPDDDSERTGDITGLNITVNDGETLYFRWYGYNSEGGGGTWRINNSTLEIKGTVSAAVVPDSDTEIFEPIPQIPSADIASTVNTSGTAIDVFKISIEDQNSGDGLDTKVTNIRIKPHTTNTADWTDHIQGIVIDDGAVSLTPTSVTITDTEIDIVFPATGLVIPDAGPLTDVTIAIYLNTSNISDNSIFSCFVEGNAHGFTADASGSTFTSSLFSGDFNSNDFTIEIDASEMRFQTQPSDVEVSAVMSPSVVVTYTDVNGNIDEDMDGAGFAITSLTTTGTFGGTATTSVDAILGVATFSNLIFSATGSNLTITASDFNDWIGTTASITSSTFDVTAAAAAAGDIVISEYMANPDCVASDNQAEYFELYNTTGTSIDINGWTIIDDGSNSHTFGDGTGSTVIAAGAYLLCAVGNPATYFDSAPNYLYSFSDFGLTNSDDEIVLKEGATEICRVNYANGDQFGAGISAQLPSNYNYSLADDGTIAENEYVEPNTTFGCGDFGTPGAANILPINLTFFTATNKQTTTLLQWQTVTEINNDYMAIERSTDGRTFNQIGQVQGAGTSYVTNNYSFVDEKPKTGINYYRLRQVDYDGRAEIHKTVSVVFGENGGTVQVYPTGVASALNVIFTKTTTTETQLIIVDVTGKEWLRTTLAVGQSQHTLDVSSLVAGQFFLQVQNAAGVEVARFVKL